jgi:hypothetical protein
MNILQLFCFSGSHIGILICYQNLERLSKTEFTHSQNQLLAFIHQVIEMNTGLYQDFNF